MRKAHYFAGILVFSIVASMASLVVPDTDVPKEVVSKEKGYVDATALNTLPHSHPQHASNQFIQSVFLFHNTNFRGGAKRQRGRLRH